MTSPVCWPICNGARCLRRWQYRSSWRVFNVQFRGRDIFEIRVPLSGVTHSIEFEWREAAHWARYRWEEFADLDGDEQAAIVAHYRAHTRLEAVLAQDLKRRADNG